jgi:tetratricopeptide (TPR) repeat protein
MRDSFALKVVVLLLSFALLSGCSGGVKKTRIRERADNYFKQQDYEKAKIEYLNLLRVESQSPHALQQLGLIWMKLGAPLQALPFLLKVRELTPENMEARAQLAIALMQAGSSTEARKEAAAILQRDPANPQMFMILADASATKEEISSAEEQLEKVPNKNTAAFHIAKGALGRKKGDVGMEADELQQAVQVEPKSARAHLALGYAYQLRGNPDHAGAELKLAAELASPRSQERIRYAQFEAANNHSAEAKSALDQIAKETPDYLPVWLELAKLATAEHKYDEGLSLLQNLFSRNPDDPEGRLLESQIWLGKGETAKAVFLADHLSNKYPNNPSIKYILASIYIASNNIPQAEIALQQAIAIRPDYSDAVLLLADLSLRTGKAQNAINPLEALVKTRPDLAQARMALANAYRGLGRLDDAATLLREQIKLTPQLADAYYSYGGILRQQNKNDEARGAFQKASELAPDAWLPVDQLLALELDQKRYGVAAQLVEQTTKKHPDTAGSAFLEGVLYYSPGPQHDFGRAEAALQKAIKLDPNFGPAYETLKSLYILDNKLPQAITQLKAEMNKNPNDPRPVLTAALVYEQMKDYSSARDAYQKALELTPDSVVALNNLAYLYAERLGQIEKAYDLAQKARNLDPANGVVADTLAWVLYKRGDYQQALPLATESAAKFPDSPTIQFHLGMISYMMGDLGTARRAFEKAVNNKGPFADKDEVQRRLASLQNATGGKGEQSISELEGLIRQQPSDIVLLQRLAEAYRNNREYEKAGKTYERVVKLNPKLPAAVISLAQLYSGPLGKRDQALELAKKARELSPNNPEATAAIGHIALEAGNYRWAYSLLQESAHKNSNDIQVLHDLALAAYANGKVPEARETMQRYLNVSPAGEQTEEAKQFLTLTALEQSSGDATAADHQQVEERLSAHPDDIPALMAKAAIELKQNDEKSATDIYLKVLQNAPDFAPAQKRLAAIYAENPENLAKAYGLAMKARKTLPEDPALARTLARISFKRNEFAYAVQVFQESATKNPLSAEDLFYFGMAQLQNKQGAKGRETLERALSAGLQGPLAQEAKKHLAEQKPD